MMTIMLPRLRRNTCQVLKHVTILICVTLLLSYLICTWRNLSRVVPVNRGDSTVLGHRAVDDLNKFKELDQTGAEQLDQNPLTIAADNPYRRSQPSYIKQNISVEIESFPSSSSRILTKFNNDGKSKDKKINLQAFPDYSKKYNTSQNQKNEATYSKYAKKTVFQVKNVKMHEKAPTEHRTASVESVADIEEVEDDGDHYDETLDIHRPQGKVNSSTSLVIDAEWVQALRARTSRVGIQRKRNLHWTIAQAGQYSSHLFTPPPGEVPEQRFPQAIIFGVGKCGTRALIEFLRMHPYIVPASVEVHFFDKDENFAKGYDWYLEQMPLSYSNQITMEKSPSYIWSERAVTEIYKLNKKMKLIVIMKDPVVRLVAIKSRTDPNISELNSIPHVDPNHGVIQTGEYVRYLKVWFQRFLPSQIHVIEGNEFIKNPAAEIQKVESFLGVPHMISEKNFVFNATKGFFCTRPLHHKYVVCLSQKKGRAHPPLDARVEKLLYQHYQPYNQELFHFLGRRFPWYSAGTSSYTKTDSSAGRSESSLTNFYKKETPNQAINQKKTA